MIYTRAERRPYARYLNPAEEARQRSQAAGRPGFYAVHAVKGAVAVAMEIAWGPSADPITGEPLDRSWYWTYVINGEPYGEPTIRAEDHAGFLRFEFARRIDKKEYDFLVAHRAWAARHAPRRPEANPKDAVDFNTAPLLF